MKNKFVTTLLLAVLSVPVFAEVHSVRILVNGVVCAFCAQGLTKKFSAQPEIDTVNVNLDDKTVKLTFKQGKGIPDDTIKTLITEAGFQVVKIER